MKDLHYGTTVLTIGDEFCDALFAYSVALITARKADVVTTPLLLDGTRVESKLLLGVPVSLFCLPSSQPTTDLADAALVAELRAKTASYGPVTPEPYDDAPVLPIVDGYDTL
jgi:hypothetical protein